MTTTAIASAPALPVPAPVPLSGPGPLPLFQAGAIAPRSFAGIEVLRAFAGLAVVVIHCHVFEADRLTAPTVLTGWLDAALWLVTHLAVPFFFAASGFFFQRSMDHRGPYHAARKSLSRVAGVLLFWSLVYGLVPTLDFVHRYPDTFLQEYWSITWMELELDVLEVVLYGLEIHLWFPSSLCLVLVMAWACRSLRRDGLLLVLGLAAYAAGLLGQSYGYLLPDLAMPWSTRIAPWNGTLFFAMGAWCARWAARHDGDMPGSLRTARWLLASGVALVCLEVLGLWRHSGIHLGYYYLGTPVAVAGLLGIGLHGRGQGRVHGFLARLGRINLGVFGCHVLFVYLLDDLKLSFAGDAAWRVIMPLAAYVLAVCCTQAMACIPALRRYAL